MKRRNTKRNRSSSSSTSSSSASNSDSEISSSTSSSSSSSSSSSLSDETFKKSKRKRKRKNSTSGDDDVNVKQNKHFKQKAHKIIKKRKLSAGRHAKQKSSNAEENECNTDIPISLMEAPKTMAPMTKEEWEKQQSKIKKVFDESTGRHRLIKGDGEVIEEIVSRERHNAINKQATKGDGNYFQAKINTSLTDNK